jgi:hypothetical protein
MSKRARHATHTYAVQKSSDETQCRNAVQKRCEMPCNTGYVPTNVFAPTVSKTLRLASPKSTRRMCPTVSSIALEGFKSR